MFGYSLAQEVINVSGSEGFWGIFYFGISASITGVAALKFLVYMAAVVFEPQVKI